MLESGDAATIARKPSSDASVSPARDTSLEDVEETSERSEEGLDDEAIADELLQHRRRALFSLLFDAWRLWTSVMRKHKARQSSIIDKMD